MPARRIGRKGVPLPAAATQVKRKLEVPVHTPGSSKQGPVKRDLFGVRRNHTQMSDSEEDSMAISKPENRKITHQGEFNSTQKLPVHSANQFKQAAGEWRGLIKDVSTESFRIDNLLEPADDDKSDSLNEPDDTMNSYRPATGQGSFNPPLIKSRQLATHRKGKDEQLLSPTFGGKPSQTRNKGQLGNYKSDLFSSGNEESAADDLGAIAPSQQNLGQILAGQPAQPIVRKRQKTMSKNRTNMPFNI